MNLFVITAILCLTSLNSKTTDSRVLISTTSSYYYHEPILNTSETVTSGSWINGPHLLRKYTKSVVFLFRENCFPMKWKTAERKQYFLICLECGSVRDN